MANQVRPRSPARTRRAPNHAGRAGTENARGRLRRLWAGGTEGNERLTVLAGLLLIVLLAVLGVTIVQIGSLLWLHLFLGLLLMGPVALKMASTGYRFMKYYTHNRRYRVKGPPPPVLRMLAPLVVGLTVIVFASGVALLLIGPTSSIRSQVFLIHKASFIAWLVFTAIHVLGHLPEILRFLRISQESRTALLAQRSTRPRGGSAPEALPAARLPGGSGRWLSLATALVLGLVLAVSLIPQFGSWTGKAGAAVLHHHHHHHPGH